MLKNNFDTSSTGINIEFYGCYDCDLSRIDFNECTTRIDDDFYFWKEWGNFKQPETIGEIATLTKGIKRAELVEIFDELNEWTDAESLTVKELKYEILNSDKLKILNDYYCSKYFKLKKDWRIYNTRGYCQGDSCDVLVNNAVSNDFIDRVFWDAPVYAELTINDIEYNYNEYDLDYYDWNRDGFAAAVAKDAGIDVNLLLDILPDQLNYEG